MTGLHVVESGPADAPVVVLVHGTMDRSGGFARVAKHLDDDHRVVRYDRRGYARSRGVGPPFTSAAHVDDLLAVLAGRQAAVVGHSYGGNVALAASVRAPEQVLAVGAYELPMPWQPWWPGTTAASAALAADRDGGPEDAAEEFLRAMLGAERWERLSERTRADRRAEGPALVGEMIDLRSTAPWTPDEVTVGVVGGHGTQSRPHHPPGVRWLVGAIPGAELVVVEGAGHGAHLTHPEGFAEFARRVSERAQGTGTSTSSPRNVQGAG